jgi:hypothetical protein
MTITVLNPTVLDRHPTAIIMHIPELRYTRSCRSYQQCSEVYFVISPTEQTNRTFLNT